MTVAKGGGNATLRVVPNTTPSVFCPFSIDNGCASSMVGQPGSAAVLIPNGRLSPTTNGVNALTGSTTDYSSQPGTRFATENFPAVDYWVGEYTTLGSLKDPLDPVVGVVATTPAGVCAYQSTGGSNGSPRMECTNINTGNAPSGITISGFDFTRGGTTCIPLDAEGTSTGTLTIKDNYWKNVTGDCTPDAVSNPHMLKGGLTFGSNEIAYNTLDMNASVFPYDYGSCNPAFGCNPSEAFVFFGSMNIHHNAFS